MLPVSIILAYLAVGSVVGVIWAHREWKEKKERGSVTLGNGDLFVNVVLSLFVWPIVVIIASIVLGFPALERCMLRAFEEWEKGD